jgi:hypothetical protein
MRIAVKGSEVAGKPLAYIIIGDGYTELRVLEAMGDKLNHSEVLLYARRGISIGLSAALDTLAMLFSLDKRVSKYLLIIDREHVKNVDDVVNGLLARGFTVKGMERCYDDACYVFIVERGGRRGAVVVSIQGKERSIEENIAELIRMHYNEGVGSDKKSVKEWFKRKGLSVEEAIERSNHELLEKAFPALIKALNTLRQVQT